MNTPRYVVIRGFLAGVLAAVVGAGAFLAYVAWYTGTDRILPGVKVGPTPVGGLDPRQARGRLAGPAVWRPPVLAGGPGAAGGQPVGGTGGVGPQLARSTQRVAVARLRWDERIWSLPLAEVGPLPDVRTAVQSASAIGRSGPLWHRARQFLVGVVHGHHVPVESLLREQVVANQLEAIARELNQPARDATYDFESDMVTEDEPGRALDMAESMKAIRQAVLTGQSDVELVVKPVPPRVRKQDLRHARQYQITRFTTRILAADPGRVHNIAMAVKKISGRVVQPGEIFSFNDVVGPRDAEHGWAQAKELYQGEFVLGYGGGICQVSSTLYNSVLLSGLEVKERFHHDRPLQYVQPGRDATVAWQVLDFKFRNNLDMPLLVGSRIIPGTPQQIEVTFHAPEPMPQNSVRLEDGEVRYFPPDMIEEIDPNLPADAREVLDEGHYGIEVKTFRIFQEGDQERRELVSHDRYQPKPGKVRVGAGNAPGSQKLLDPGFE